MRPVLSDDTERILHVVKPRVEKLEQNINEQRTYRGKGRIRKEEFKWRSGPKTFDNDFLIRFALKMLRDNVTDLKKIDGGVKKEEG